MVPLNRALDMLRITLANVNRGEDSTLRKIVDAKGEVLERYQPVFAPDGVQTISKEVFQSFLLFRNNKHWGNLHRQKNYMCEDMDSLRKGLSLLVNEEIPIEERIDILIPQGKPPMVKGLGRAVLTAILQVVYPEKYGVWNNTAISGMQHVGVFPSFQRGIPSGQRYLQINGILLQLAKEMNIDLWTLDSLWWRVAKIGIKENEDEEDDEVELLNDTQESGRFRLESQLQEFLEVNWDQTLLAHDWYIYEEEGELASNYYAGEAGQIDLLAHHKKEKRWLVIELKRNQSSDKTVGQVLRYMGWVKENLADKNDEVEGLIISHVNDVKLQYALNYTKNVDVLLYEVKFSLRKPTR